MAFSAQRQREELEKQGPRDVPAERGMTRCGRPMCHRWEGDALGRYQRALNVLLGFGDVSASYEEHGRNFALVCG